MLHTLKKLYYSSSYKYIWYASLVMRGLFILYVLAGVQKIFSLPSQLFNLQSTLLMCALLLITLLIPYPGLKGVALHRALRQSVVLVVMAFVMILLTLFFGQKILP